MKEAENIKKKEFVKYHNLWEKAAKECDKENDFFILKLIEKISK